METVLQLLNCSAALRVQHSVAIAAYWRKICNSCDVYTVPSNFIQRLPMVSFDEIFSKYAVAANKAEAANFALQVRIAPEPVALCERDQV